MSWCGLLRPGREWNGGYRPGPRLHLDPRLSPLGRTGLCVEPGRLGAASPRARPLGSGPLGADTDTSGCSSKATGVVMRGQVPGGLPFLFSRFSSPHKSGGIPRRLIHSKGYAFPFLPGPGSGPFGAAACTAAKAGCRSRRRRARLHRHSSHPQPEMARSRCRAAASQKGRAGARWSAHRRPPTRSCFSTARISPTGSPPAAAGRPASRNGKSRTATWRSLPAAAAS